MELTDVDPRGAQQALAEAIAGLELVEHDPVALRIADPGHPDRLVLPGIEALSDRLDPLDAIAPQHPLALLAHHAHAFEDRRIAARGARADRAIEVVEHRQQLLDELAPRVLGVAPGVAR